MIRITNCRLCPRVCGADRTSGQGDCGGGNQVRVARAALHFWEEPCISGQNGSGTVFFSGCPLRCCFCQNGKISAGNFGKEISVNRLAEIFLMLQAQGAHNINLVNPTHYLPWVRDALQLARLRVPVVWNSGGYERAEALRAMEGLVDIYLPDLKYASSVRAERYSGASDYWAAATKAIREMHRQTGKPVWDASGLLRKGVVIRHLVLPKGVQDAAAVLDWIAGTFLPGEVLVSLMSQYTPCGDLERFPELRRRISSYEYKIVLAHAQSLGLEGFMQERSSAREEYTPPFDLEGV